MHTMRPSPAGAEGMPDAQEVHALPVGERRRDLTQAEASALDAAAGRIAEEIARRMPDVAVYCKGCIKQIVIAEMMKI